MSTLLLLSPVEVIIDLATYKKHKETKLETKNLGMSQNSSTSFIDAQRFGSPFSSRCVEILRLPAPLDILAKGNLSDAVAANLADSDADVTNDGCLMAGGSKPWI